MRVVGVDLNEVLKYSFYGLLLVIAFAMLVVPLEFWLPFADNFPLWLTSVPLIYYLPELVILFAMLFVAGLVYWFVREMVI